MNRSEERVKDLLTSNDEDLNRLGVKILLKNIVMSEKDRDSWEMYYVYQPNNHTYHIAGPSVVLGDYLVFPLYPNCYTVAPLEDMREELEKRTSKSYYYEGESDVDGDI